jgi:hypothetical protein
MSPLCLSLVIRVNGVEPLPNHPGYIWEDQEQFGKAFRLARTFLGANDIFTWKGNLYTTQYREEQ